MTDYLNDLLGQPVTITYPDGSRTTYTSQYGKVIGVSRRESGATVDSPVASLTYTPTGDVAKVEYANGFKTVNTYDSSHLNRLTRRLTYGMSISMSRPNR